MRTLHDQVILAAVTFDTTPEAPPGSEGLMMLLSWLMWGVFAACFAAVVVSGGKFAWERWQTGTAHAPKMFFGALAGAVIAGSAGSLMSAVQ